ncbi:hypothetical protein ATG70_3093 [Bacillus sp. es.036]|jgi:hypothetical protein|nr:hypothetical protein ATG70_3093 [Bacillus sp. es.036]
MKKLIVNALLITSLVGVVTLGNHDRVPDSHDRVPDSSPSKTEIHI